MDLSDPCGAAARTAQAPPAGEVVVELDGTPPGSPGPPSHLPGPGLGLGLGLPGTSSTPGLSMAAGPISTALAKRPNLIEANTNTDFLIWLRSIPKEERMERIQKVVKRSVIGKTSAKLTILRLRSKVEVRLEKLDVLRCVINHYAQHRSNTNSAEFVEDVAPVRRKSPTKVASQRPCPLSRKRQVKMDSSHIQDKQPKLVDLSEESENAKDKEPDNPAVEGLPQRSINCLPAPSCSVDMPEQCSDDSAVVRSESAKRSPLSRSPSAPSESPLKHASASHQAETPSAALIAKSRPKETKQPIMQSASMVLSSTVQKPQQAPMLTARIIDSEIADVALAIAATEAELVKLHEQLVSFERLGPSSKKNTRTITALLESSAILENKAKCVKSCVDKGVMKKLGNTFYPRLLHQVQKNQKLNLYSNMRLMSMVNMLLGLSLPNSDPRHTLSAFVAKSLYDQRPRAQSTEDTAPRIVPSKSTVQPITKRFQEVSVITENMTQSSSGQPTVPVAGWEGTSSQVPQNSKQRFHAALQLQPSPNVTVDHTRQEVQQLPPRPQNVISHQILTQVQERGHPVNAALPQLAPYRQSGVQVIPNVSPVARTTSRDSGIATPELH
ncbi:tRNA-splicing endonuclease subunit Sen2-1 [Frankliniella fusca]|uniref:tRNA-splicing endonuclease subunit Sen2-1 n=1 Tax=Frankliniella fusca TaxID=407009 RepID=A0AAE1HPJ6_9NEOP|nr:tRNA-splicing endonuclease subunit Sen2-1 [Frankliniella fusca]